MALSKKLAPRDRSYPLIILVVIVAALVIGVSTILNTQKQTPTPQPVVNTSPSPVPSSNLDGWHINNSQHWATYSNPDAPIIMQYPPQWGYKEVTHTNVGG